jgi:DNA-binding NarL/FixJ family response regulator
MWGMSPEASDEPDASPLSPPVPPRDPDRPRLVIADDDAAGRALLRQYLESEDMEVVSEASDGAEVVPLVLRDHPDVVLMDMRMPSVDGLEAAGRIHATSPGTQVVLFSAYPTKEIWRQAEELGVYLVLEKDQPTLVIDAVKGAVALKRWSERESS